MEVHKLRKLGKMIKMLRDSKNLTRKEFCKIAGISTSGLAYYENENRNPSGKILQKIVQNFNLSRNYFTVEIDENEISPAMQKRLDEKDYIIQLQKEKIESLESFKAINLTSKPTYHFFPYIIG